MIRRLLQRFNSITGLLGGPGSAKPVVHRALRPLSREVLEQRELLSVAAWSEVGESAWPDGWETMEIEAKWTTTEPVLETLKAEFNTDDSDRAFTFAGTTEYYDINVRWKGRPRRFTDHYYDNPSKDLSDAMHGLRHRTREKWDGTHTAPEFDDDLSHVLDNSAWRETWQKVQYKGTPERLGAVWMRDEFGSAQLTPQQVADTLNGETVAIHGGDDPVASAEADHPDIVWMGDTPLASRIDDFLLVVDVRYRVQFLDPHTGEERYELSLDKVRQYWKDPNGEYTTYVCFFEAELEALIDDGDQPQEHTEAEISELFRLVGWFENRYATLEPSTTSKGGNQVIDIGTHESAEEPSRVSLVGDTVMVYGTDADDMFAFTAADETCTVVFNGQVHGFSADEIDAIVVDGCGGNDTAVLRGTTGDETAWIHPSCGVFAAEGVDVTLTNTAEITVFGGGGNDVAYLDDSAGDDQFVGTPTYAAMHGDGFYNRVRFFGEVYVEAIQGGVDVARVFDSPGDDLCVATSTYGEVSGSGFKNIVRYFEGVHVYGTAGGSDLARLYDSSIDDIFYADPSQGALYIPGRYFNRVKFFEGVHAYATAGGLDVARLHGSQHNDSFYRDRHQCAMYLPGQYFNRGKFFEESNAFGHEGDDDQAMLHDLAVDEMLEAEGNWARLTDSQLGSLCWVSEFDYMKVISTADNNTANVRTPLLFALDLEGYWQDRKQ